MHKSGGRVHARSPTIFEEPIPPGSAVTDPGANPLTLAFKQLSERTQRLFPLTLASSGQPKDPLAVGVRHYLTEAEGSGYWEYFKPADHLVLSVTDAGYRQTQWIEVPPAPILKLRLLLTGQLLGADGDAVLTGPQAHLHMCPGSSAEGYFIAGGEQETKLVVLHCGAQFIEQTLGVSYDELPPPIDAMLAGNSSSSTQRISLSPQVLHAALRIIDSRHGIPSGLRCPYLKSMATTILCEVFAELSHRDRARRSAVPLHSRDLNRIYEARDYLTQHYRAPPTIPQLALMLGINQTKLKAGFRAVLGLTVYQYVLERRMEVASELLLTREHNVTEIAYRVGYEYPANFSYAFKRHFGRLPHAWTKQP